MAGDSFALSTPSPLTYTAGQNVTIQWTGGNRHRAQRVDQPGLRPQCDRLEPQRHWMYNVATAANGTGTYAWNTAGVAAGTYYLSGYLWDATAGQPLTASSTPRRSSFRRATALRFPPPAR